MPSLSQIIALPSLGLTELVARPQDAAVRWVATSELADPTPYLEGGEILLTTGLDTREWSGQWRDYAARLSQAGVLAVGFGVGLTHESVPVELRVAAAEFGFGLFSVPRAAPFIAIGQAVGEALAAEERGSLLEAVSMQRELTRAGMDGDGASSVLTSLAGLLDGVAVILDSDGEIVSTARGDAGPRGEAGLSDGAIASARVQLERIRSKGFRGAAADFSANGSQIVQPLGLAGTPDRYLVVASSARWSAAQRSSITTAVALLSLDAARQAESHETSRRLRAGAVALLLGGQADAAAAVLAQLPGQTELPSRVQVLRCQPAADSRALLRVVERLAAATGGFAIAAEQPQFVAVVAAGSSATAVSNRLVELGAHVGVGVASADARHSDESATAAALHATAHRPVVHFADLAARGVAAALDPATGEAFARQALGPILDAGEESTPLLATLRAYLGTHGQSQPTATALGIHRNTVRHRIGRIEELLGASLADPQIRVDLWVALQLLD